MLGVSEPAVLAPASSLLPSRYEDLKVRSALSSDGQVYVLLPDGHGEARLEITEVFQMAADAGSASGTEQEGQKVKKENDRERKRKGSGGKKRQRPGQLEYAGWQIARHLAIEARRCADCGHQETVTYFAWEDRRCSNCWSTNTDVLRTRFSSERPATFLNVGMPDRSWQNIGRPHAEGHVWGCDPIKDGQLLNHLSHHYRFDREGHAKLYTLRLFGETFIEMPQCQGEDLFTLVLNVGNVTQLYFQLTSSPEAARATLNLFERAATIEHDPDPVLVAKHSFGMAATYVLRTFNEAQAAVATGRPELRQQSLTHLRDALSLIDRIASRDPDSFGHQRSRVLYALADVLSLGNPTAEQLAESLSILRELPNELNGKEHAVFVRAARAQVQLLSPLPQRLTKKTIKPYRRAIDELDELMHSKPPTPTKYGNRWRWALAVGKFAQQISFPDNTSESYLRSLAYLESAVTFILKDTSFSNDPVIASADSERYYDAFRTLATNYTLNGWWFEAISLLETFRGQAIELESLTSEQRRERALKAERRREKRYFVGPDQTYSTILDWEASWEAEFGQPFGSFTDDYRLKGLSKRLLALFKQLREEETALVSLSIDDTIQDRGPLVSAIILGPPRRPPRLGKHRVWALKDEALSTLTSDLHRHPSSFREARLDRLSANLWEHIIRPIEEDLKSFACPRALVVAPSSLSNLPFEAFRRPESSASDVLPLHFAFTPSFQFRAGRPRHIRRRGNENLLIIGYHGSDLPHADREAAMLKQVFGERTTYLTGLECNKRKVLEELNGQYDFIHFVCHGTYDNDWPGESSLYFRNIRTADAYRVSAQELREFVRFQNEPVITLSACSTALTADSRSNTWGGLSGSFLACGARCIIGTRWPVADRVAEEIMSQFYELIHNTDRSSMECFHLLQDQERSRRPVEEWACFGYLGTP
jgi:hypothetical protein